MITMDVKGINWVGNMYQKFENMCLEAEDIMYEDTVQYIENQMQAVGASVKKLYSDVIGDLLPPLSCDLDEIEKGDSELPINQCTDDATLDQKPFQNFKERPAKANTKQIEDSRLNHYVDNNDCTHDRTSNTDASFKPSSRHSVKGFNFISHSRKHVGIMDIKSNLALNENKQNRKMVATKTFNEIASLKTDTYKTSQCCEISNEDQIQNQNHGTGVSKPASAEATRLTNEADHCNEIKKFNIEQIPAVKEQVRSAEEKEIDMNSSCGPFGEPVDFSMARTRTTQSDYCSDSMVVVSYPEQSQETIEEDHLKLEETCVMVSGDELQLLVPKGAAGNVKTKKKTRRKGFCLSKKSARKQEYEELAVWHGKSEKVKGNCMVIDDQNKSLLPPPSPSSVAEAEWELL